MSQAPKFRQERDTGMFHNAQKDELPVKKFGPAIPGPAMYLEIWRAKLRKCEERLQAKREEYKERRLHVDESWKEIDKKGQHLKQNFKSFNRFLMDNMEKRKRASENLQHNRELCEEREKEIENLKTQIQSIQESKTELDESVRKYGIYEDYLYKVVEESDVEGFKHAEHIVQRFEYYSELAADLSKKQEETFDILQNAKTQLNKFIDENKDHLLALHTKAATLQGAHEKVTRRTRHLENLVAKIRTQIIRKYSEANNVKAAIWNLYCQMCKLKKNPITIKKHDFESQLIYINSSMKQNQKIKEEVVKKMRKSTIKSK